jgi:hypothetical protein
MNGTFAIFANGAMNLCCPRFQKYCQNDLTDDVLESDNEIVK